MFQERVVRCSDDRLFSLTRSINEPVLFSFLFFGGRWLLVKPGRDYFVEKMDKTFDMSKPCKNVFYINKKMKLTMAK